MEFPRADLLNFCELLLRCGGLGERYVEGAHAILVAIKRHEELSERCVMDRAELSLEIANLRAQLREIDPSFPADA